MFVMSDSPGFKALFMKLRNAPTIIETEMTSAGTFHSFSLLGYILLEGLISG